MLHDRKQQYHSADVYKRQVCTLIERFHCTDNNHFRIFFFDDIEDHCEAFFEDISDKIFISDTDVFQIEWFRMPGFEMCIRDRYTTSSKSLQPETHTVSAIHKICIFFFFI